MRSGLRDAGPLALAGFAANGANVVVTVLVAAAHNSWIWRAGTVDEPLSHRVYAGHRRGRRRGSPRHGIGCHGTQRGCDDRRVPCARTDHRGGGRNGDCRFVGEGPACAEPSIPVPLGVFAIIVAGAVWVLLSLDRGLLQARRRYRALSVNLLVEGGTRTAAVLCFVGCGMGVAGVAWGFLLAEVVTAIHARLGSGPCMGSRRPTRPAQPTVRGPARIGVIG